MWSFDAEEQAYKRGEADAIANNVKIYKELKKKKQTQSVDNAYIRGFESIIIIKKYLDLH